MGARRLEEPGYGIDSQDTAGVQAFGAEGGELADGSAAENDNDISE
jgi:hypothetical protein